MAIEIPAPIAGPDTSGTGLSDRQTSLNTLLKTAAPDAAAKIQDTFKQTDLNPADLKSALDKLPVDDATKHNLWSTYYMYEPPKPPAAPAKAAPAPGLLSRLGSKISSAANTAVTNMMPGEAPAPLPPPPVPAGVKPPLAAVAPKAPGPSFLDKAYGATPPALPVPPGPSKVAPASFNTKLSPADEVKFQAWKKQNAPNDSGEDYDLRGAFKAGVTPDPTTGHWPDTFKKPNHPTFSNESQYAAFAPDKAGHWDGDTFVPPAAPTKTPLAPAAETGWMDIVKGLPAAAKTVASEAAKQTVGERIRNAFGNITNMAGGLLNSASMDYYDPEKGTVTIPTRLIGLLSAAGSSFDLVPRAMDALNSPKQVGPIQVHRSLSDVLQNDWKVPADIAQDGTAAHIGNFIGVMAPWESISSTLAGATNISQANAIVKAGSEGIGGKTAEKAYGVVTDILKHAGIQAATGETFAHLENAPDNETAAQRELRAGQTALYGAAFSVLFDSVAHGLASTAESQAAAAATGKAPRAVDDIINDVYDAFYKSGSFSSEEAARTAANKAYNSAMEKVGQKAVTPEEFLDSVKRRFEANKAAGASTPAVEPPESVSESKTNIAPEATSTPSPIQPPDNTAPTPAVSSPIPAPKTVLQYKGQDIVGISGTRAVLADGTTHGRSPSHISALRSAGYTNLTPAQVSDLVSKSAAKSQEPAPVPEPENVPPQEEPETTPLPKAIEPPEKEEPATAGAPVPAEPEELPPVVPQQGEIPAIEAPKKQFTHGGKNVMGTSDGKIVLSDGSTVVRPPAYIKTLGLYGYKELSPEQISMLSGTAAVKEAHPADLDLTHLPSDVHYIGDQKGSDGETALHMFNLVLPDGGKATFAIKPGGDIEAAASKKRDEFAASDAIKASTPPTIESPAAEQQKTPEVMPPPEVPSPEATALPETKESGSAPDVATKQTPGQEWAKSFDEDWYDKSINGAEVKFHPEDSEIPSFEEVRDIYSKMIDMFPDHRQTLPDMLHDLIERRVMKRPYPIELAAVTKALGMPQPDESTTPRRAQRTNFSLNANDYIDKPTVADMTEDEAADARARPWTPNGQVLAWEEQQAEKNGTNLPAVPDASQSEAIDKPHVQTLIPGEDADKDLGPRWTINKDLGSGEDGEGQYWLDGTDTDTANAGIGYNETTKTYHVELKDGRSAGNFPTLQAAADAAENAYPQRSVSGESSTPKAIAAPTSKGELPHVPEIGSNESAGGDVPGVGDTEPTQPTEAIGGSGESPERSGEPGGEDSGAVPGEGARQGRDERTRGSGTDAISGGGIDNSGFYRITEADKLGVGGPKAKFQDNLKAIRILKSLMSEERLPTADERKALVRYVGWGGLSEDAFSRYNRETGELARELENLLTPDEYESARASTKNAHFTSEDVIKFVWGLAQRLGFNGNGTILETSMGSGNFLGLAPDSAVKKGNFIGAELDPITGNIAKYLYPGASIRIGGYQSLMLPDNSVDIAIGNVPFGTEKPYDPRYKDLKLVLHDYFFIKTLDKIRPGGVIAFITSKGTMDKVNDRVRDLIADKADLVAAYRFPNTAFAKNARTEVTTDLIILQKREPGSVRAGESFSKTQEIQPDLRINEYYARHPENMLGKMALTGSMYGANEPTLEPTDPLVDMMRKALESAPKGIMRGRQRASTGTSANIVDQVAPDTVKELAYTINDKGQLVQRIDGVLTKPADSSLQNKLPQMKALIDLREQVKKVIATQLTTDDDVPLQAEQEALNKVYDAYVNKYGILNGKDSKIFDEDPQFPLLLALENYQSETKTVTKTSIFTKRTIKPILPLETVSGDPKEALIQVLGERGYPDLALLSQLAGKPEDEIATNLERQGLIFKNPGSGTYETSAVYLSGYVRDKLEAARTAARQDQAYRRNVEALESVQPEQIPVSDIEVKLGAAWISPDAYAAFIREALGGYSATVKRLPDGKWSVEFRAGADVNLKWGSAGIMASQIMETGMNLGQPTVWNYDEDGNRHVAQKETIAAREKLDQMKQEFNRWPQTSDEWGKHLAEAYNNEFNGIALAKYDGSHLTLPGISSDFKPRAHQSDAVWRIITDGRALLAHVVGSGKAQPLDSKILTPFGWKQMGDILIGDLVIGRNGKPTEVTGVFPQGEKEIFRVLFSDGSSTECCDEHLWLTRTYRERGYSQRAIKFGRVNEWKCGDAKIRPLSEIRNSLRSDHLNALNHSIPIVDAVDFMEQPLPIDPYVIGVLLGDGGISGRRAVFTSLDSEIVNEVSAALPSSVQLVLVKQQNRAATYGLTMTANIESHSSTTTNLISKALVGLGLQGLKSEFKFIPECYIFNSVKNRISVLQGLMDTDGWVDKRGMSTHFGTTSSILADNVTEIVRSLGGTTSRSSKVTSFTYKGERKTGLLFHQLTISLPNCIVPFRLKRKIDRLVPKTKYPPRRYVVDIVSVGPKQAQCISVSDPEHLYVTDDYIVTHNTFTAIAAGMELKRLGISKKNMYVVPNNKVEQWRRMFLEAYPAANILSIGRDDLAGDSRRQSISRIATGDWDAVILQHSSFGRIPISPERMAKTIQNELDELEETLSSSKAAAGRGSKRDPSVKALEKAKSKLEEHLKALQDAPRDNVINFDELGIDYMFIDELHEFKNLAYYTKMNNVSGLGQKDAKKGLDLKSKTDYIQEKNRGRGVIGMTGTPVSNTMAEVYNMMRYVAPDVLTNAGIKFFDDWAANFGDVITVMELSPDGRTYRARSKFARFTNAPELMKMFRSFTDVKHAGDLNLPTPAVEGGQPTSVTIPTNSVIEPIFNDLLARAESLRADPAQSREKGGDNWLKLTGDGKKIALDARLYDADLPDHPDSKSNKAVENIYKYYKADPGTTQIVFADMYQDRTEKFNLYKDIKKKLIAKGVPAAEIAIAHDFKNDEQQAQMQSRMNAGEIRVLIGSTAKIGVGLNVQRKLKTLHNLDAPWRPDQLEQRGGRIIRQGNENETVRLLNYVTERSFDAYIFQALETKARFIRQIMSGDVTGRNIDDAAGDVVLQYSELKAIASGNPDVKRKIELETAIRKLDSLQSSHITEERKRKSVIAQKEQDIITFRTQVAAYESTKNLYDKYNEDHPKTTKDENRKFDAIIGGKDFTDSDEFVKHIDADPNDAFRTDGAATVYGVPVKFETTPFRRNARNAEGAYILDKHGFRVDEDYDRHRYVIGNEKIWQDVPETGGSGLLLSVKHKLDKVSADIKRVDEMVEEASRQIKKITVESGKPFQYTKQLEDASAELAQVNARLQPPDQSNQNNALLDVGEDEVVDKTTTGSGSDVTPPDDDGGRKSIEPVRGPSKTLAGRASKLPNVPILKPPLSVGGETYPSTMVNVSDSSKEGKLTPVVGWTVAPGLAVTEGLGTKNKYSVTHVPSGLAVKTDIDDAYKAVGIAKRVADLGDWTRSKDALMSDTDFLKSVQSKLSGERGGIRLFQQKAPPPIPAALIPSPDHDMQQMLLLPNNHASIWDRIKKIPAEVKHFATASRYNEDIKDFPVFAERVRRAEEIVNDAASKTQRKLSETLKGLHPVEYEVFRAIVYWEDMYETGARSGEDRIPLPGLDKLTRIDSEINRLQGISTQAVTDAVDRHGQWMSDLWDDFVKRGKADAGDGRVKYFPNMILHDLGDAIDRIPGLPMRMQNPRRLYLKERKGHATAHNSDYIQVMEQYATRAYAHNMIDDFIDSAAAENDRLPSLSKQTRATLFASTGGELRPGSVYINMASGEILKGFQFNPGRVIYPVQAINEAVIRDAVDAGLDELAIDLDAFRNNLPSPHLDTVMEERLTRTAFALGGQHKLYLLPVEIANKLEHFRENNSIGPFTEMVRAATNAWKMSVTTISGGMSYFAHITIGNQITLWMEDMEALKQQPKALDILRKKLPKPQYAVLVQMMEDARIWNSTFASSGGIPRAINSPELRQYRKTSPSEKLNPFGNHPIGDALREYQRFSSIVHAIPKVAKFLADMDRIKNGKPIISKGSDLKGLEKLPYLAAGKNAREITPDYGATSPRMRLVYGTLFPFSSFAVGIIAPWMRRMAHKGLIFPGDEFMLKMLLPLVALLAWNHFIYPEIEKDVKDWQKEMTHLNTPYGVLALETPLDVVKRWGGLHTLEPNFDKVASGKWTWEQAARAQLDDMFGHQDKATWPTAPGAMLEEMVNPMAKVMMDLKADRDSFTGKDIVSKSDPNLWGDTSKAWPQTDTGKQIYREYVVKQLVSPYMQFLRASQMDSPDSMLKNWLTATGPFGWKRALGLRDIQPGGNETTDWYSNKNWQMALHDEKMQKIIDAYVEYGAGNISLEDRQAQIMPLLEQAGPIRSLTDVQTEMDNVQQRPQFKIRVLEETLHKTTDPDAVAATKAMIQSLRYQVEHENLQSSAKTAKPLIGLPPVPAPQK